MQLDQRLQSTLICHGCSVRPDCSDTSNAFSNVWVVEYQDDAHGTDQVFFVCATCAKFYQHSADCRVQRLATYGWADWSRLLDLNLHRDAWLDSSKDTRMTIGGYLNTTQGLLREWQKRQQIGRYVTAFSAPRPASPRRPLPPGLRYSVLERDGFRCKTCGRTPEQHGVVLHVDHIVAVAKGGTNDPGNLRALCAECNLGKSDR